MFLFWFVSPQLLHIFNFFPVRELVCTLTLANPYDLHFSYVFLDLIATTDVLMMRLSYKYIFVELHWTYINIFSTVSFFTHDEQFRWWS